MKNPVTFKSLLIQSLLFGFFLGLMDYFWLSQSPDFFYFLLAWVVFMLVYLTFMCWIYEINPLKGKFSSPFKDK